MTNDNKVIANYLSEKISDNLDEVVMFQRDIIDIIDSKEITLEQIKNNFKLQADMVCNAISIVTELRCLLDDLEKE